MTFGERKTPMKRASKPMTRTRMKPSRRSGRARPDEPLATWCAVRSPDCQGRATNRHHKAGRPTGENDAWKDSAEFTVDCCGSGTTGCHGYIHANPAWSYENGWLIHR